MLGEIEDEAAFHAQEVAVDPAHIAIISAQNFVVADAEGGFAAVRAMRANGGNVFHFPRPRFVAIGPAGQRANRADVDAHAALFALQMIAGVGDDHAVGAAHADSERFHVHAFVANAHAAETQNAARSIVINDFRPLFFGPVNLFFHEAAGIGAVAETHALQFALAALVADRAVQRMVGQQKFQDAFARLLDLRSVGAHLHGFGRH